MTKEELVKRNAWWYGLDCKTKAQLSAYIYLYCDDDYVSYITKAFELFGKSIK